MPVCISCGQDQPKGTLRKDGYTYQLCGCGTASLHPLPEADEAAQVYGRGYFQGAEGAGYLDYAADEPLHRRNAARRLDLLARAGCTPPGRLLDVGCAHGFFAAAASERGFDVVGVDVSRWAREQAHRRFGLTVYPRIQDAAREGPGSFDAVTFFQVLEHDPRPDLALKAARECLRPGGLLIIETWDRKSAVARLFGRHWQQLSPPSVVHIFDRESLPALLCRQGFTPAGVLPTEKTVSLGAVMALLRSKYPRLLSPLKAAERVPALRGLPLRYGLGDLITVVGRA